MARGRYQPFYILLIGCQNRRCLPEGCSDYHCINDIRSSTFTQQPPCLVRFVLVKRDDGAAHEEAPELRLLW
jgi:hypothetical protein